MEETKETYMNIIRQQLEISVEDLFRDKDYLYNVMSKLHRYDSVLLYANGERVMINMSKITYVYNGDKYIEFQFSNLSRIIVFKDKIVYHSPEYNSPHETLYRIQKEEEEEEKEEE